MLYKFRRRREYVISWLLDHDLVFTLVSHPLTLYCDYFDRGADHSERDPVIRQQSILTSDYDGELLTLGYPTK